MIGDAAVDRVFVADGRAGTESIQLPPLLLVAVGFGIGITAGTSWLPSSSPWPWLLATAPLQFVGALAFCRAPTTFFVPTAVLCAMLLGAAWVSIRTAHTPADDLAGWAVDDRKLVHVEGIALGRSETRQRLGGSLASFDYRGPSTVAPIRIDALLTHDGRRTDVSGRAYMAINETAPPFRAGDRIRATGYLTPFPPPHNPGEFDLQQYARALGQTGMITVPNRELIDTTPAERIMPYASWLRFRELLQRRAGGWLLARMPDAETMHRDVLLRALLLGQRDPPFDEISDPFKRLGIAHLLAISGLHLGMLSILALIVFRACGLRVRWQAAAVAALVLIYLMLVEVRLPVMRAGIMALAACLAAMVGRRWSVGGVLALSAIGLLLWRPDQLFTAGFQLSFGVVLGLIYLSPLVHRKLWGMPKPAARVYSSAQMIGQWAQAALTVSVTSWLVAMPIIMHHFGMIAPLGIVLSVPAVPLVALLLGLGYLKIVLEVLLPSLALLTGVPLAIIAEMLVTIVQAIDSLPWTVVHTPFPGLAWTLAAMGLVVVMVLLPGRSIIAWVSSTAMAAALAIALCWPMMPWHERPAMRLDVLSVGHGACYVLRSEGQTFIFDAGSMSTLDIGRRTIVPALRRLGVRSIDAIAVSHPHIDHYSAVIELVDEFDVEEVLVTHQFIEHAREFPGSPVAFVLDALAQRHIIARPVIKGDSLTIGAAQLTWLHPPLNLEEFGRDNEHSMVVRVDVGDRRVMLTGDVERQGLAKLASRQSELRACIVELPHHGSFNPLAQAFVTQLEPEMVFQSSSRTQWRRDRWEHVLADVQRFVTAREGAVAIEIDHDGRITAEQFLERGGVTGVP